MIKCYRIIGIVVIVLRLVPRDCRLLRLVPRDCRLVVVLGQNECGHGRSDVQQFLLCCLILDAQARKHFWIDLCAVFWRKGAPTLNLEKY